MTAAVVEPVGRKANWSSNVNEGGCVRNEGYRNLRTTARSIILVSMGVTDIGRKSECCTGAATFGTGWILASFHCVGTADVQSDKLKRYETGLQNTGAATRRNHELGRFDFEML